MELGIRAPTLLKVETRAMILATAEVGVDGGGRWRTKWQWVYT